MSETEHERQPRVAATPAWLYYSLLASAFVFRFIAWRLRRDLPWVRPDPSRPRVPEDLPVRAVPLAREARNFVSPPLSCPPPS